jgi:hypothetical protein
VIHSFPLRETNFENKTSERQYNTLRLLFIEFIFQKARQKRGFLWDTGRQVSTKPSQVNIPFSYQVNVKVKVKVKVKLSLYLTKHHAMKAYWGSEDIAPSIL